MAHRFHYLNEFRAPGGVLGSRRRAASSSEAFRSARLAKVHFAAAESNCSKNIEKQFAPRTPCRCNREEISEVPCVRRSHFVCQVTDFLDEKRREIQARLKELKPLVDEYQRPEAAERALAGVSSNGSATHIAT